MVKWLNSKELLRIHGWEGGEHRSDKRKDLTKNQRSDKETVTLHPLFTYTPYSLYIVVYTLQIL